MTTQKKFTKARIGNYEQCTGYKDAQCNFIPMQIIGAEAVCGSLPLGGCVMHIPYGTIMHISVD